MISMKVINGEGLILGRVGSFVAKQVLSGDEVVLLNAEKLVISGNIAYNTTKYSERRHLTNKANPENSPHWPKRPDLFVKRIIRGMLPFDSLRGREAAKRLRVFIGVPKAYAKTKAETLEKASVDNLRGIYSTIGKICERLGYEG